MRLKAEMVFLKCTGSSLAWQGLYLSIIKPSPGPSAQYKHKKATNKYLLDYADWIELNQTELNWMKRNRKAGCYPFNTQMKGCLWTYSV